MEEQINGMVETIQQLEKENAKLKEAINDVLDVLIDGDGVPNLVWVKNRLLETVK